MVGHQLMPLTADVQKPYFEFTSDEGRYAYS